MLRDAHGNEITVGAKVRHVDPHGHHDLGRRVAKVIGLTDHVAIVRADNYQQAYLGSSLEVVSEVRGAAA